MPVLSSFFSSYLSLLFFYSYAPLPSSLYWLLLYEYKRISLFENPVKGVSGSKVDLAKTKPKKASSGPKSDTVDTVSLTPEGAVDFLESEKQEMEVHR
jgi:hypothetical protein